MIKIVSLIRIVCNPFGRQLPHDYAWNHATHRVSPTQRHRAENEEDALNNQADSSTILNECKSDAGIGKRRPSLAQKMTSNLRRLSGAAELKIDIGDHMSNPRYCNKKIKVSHLSTFPLFQQYNMHLFVWWRTHKMCAMPHFVPCSLVERPLVVSLSMDAACVDIANKFIRAPAN